MRARAERIVAVRESNFKRESQLDDYRITYEMLYSLRVDW